MAMAGSSTVFTTGQVAKICKVAPRTVSKWFDSGRLRGYRIPGSNDRRIPRDHLIQFLKEHGMPLDGVMGDLPVVIDVASGVAFDPDTFLVHAVELNGRSVLMSVMGAIIKFPASHMVIGADVPDDVAVQCAAELRRESPQSVVIRINDSGVRSDDYTDTFRRPFDGNLLQERLLSAVMKRSRRS